MNIKPFAKSLVSVITFAGISVFSVTSANAIILGSNIKTDTKSLIEADIYLNNAFDAGSTLLVNGINWSFRITEVFAVPSRPANQPALQAIQLTEITHIKPPDANEGVNTLNSTIIFPRFTAIQGGGKFPHPPIKNHFDFGSGNYFQVNAAPQGAPAGTSWVLQAKLQHVPEPTTLPGSVLMLGFFGFMFKKEYSRRRIKEAKVKI